MLYKTAVATMHFFLASFMIVQIYGAVIDFYGENAYIGLAISVAVSISVFYLSFMKADVRYYSFKTLFVITLGYWVASTLLVILELPYFNVFLIGGLYYYLLQKNPAHEEVYVQSRG